MIATNGPPAVVVDRARERRLSGPGGPGDQHADVERRHAGRLGQDASQGATPADQLRTPESLSDLRRVVGPLVLGPHGSQPAGHQRELGREQLGPLAVPGREALGIGASLQVHHAERRSSDRGAQHSVDLVALDAATRREPRIVLGGRGLDGLSGSVRGLDDSTRHRTPDRRHLIAGAAVRPPESRAGRVIAMKLEIGDASPGELHDQRERMIEQRRDLAFAAQIEQPAIEHALTLGDIALRIVDHSCALPRLSDDSQGLPSGASPSDRPDAPRRQSGKPDVVSRSWTHLDR